MPAPSVRVTDLARELCIDPRTCRAALTRSGITVHRISKKLFLITPEAANTVRETGLPYYKDTIRPHGTIH